MSEKLPFSLCILSWNSDKTLRNSLRSYKKNGLLNLAGETLIYFQEITDRDRATAKEFGLKAFGTSENIGIGNAIIFLAQNAQFPQFLFLENDWQLTENALITGQQLSQGLNLLEEGFDVVRYRNRKRPGHPLYSIAHKGNELNYYDDWHRVTSPHLLESLHWLDPAKEFPDKIQKKDGFFVTTSRWANWTNNPFLIKKEFYLEKISPFSGQGVEFEKKIAPWWVQQNFKIAQGEGLFTHKDLKKYPEPSIIKKLGRTIKNLMK